MPVYNAAATLQRAVDAIRAQTCPDWELLLADDGSTEATPDLAAHLADMDPRIHSLPGAHRGIVHTLNHAAARARGKYLARMDADDWSHPTRLEKQAACLEENPGMTLCGTLVSVVGEEVRSGLKRYQSWVNSLTEHEDIVRELFIECPIVHPTFMLPRTAFEEVGGYEDHPWPEDYDLILRLWRRGLRFGKVPECLLEWTDSPRRLQRSDTRYAEAAFRAIKRHYLFQTYLHRDRPFLQWGAGEVGNRWLREWETRRPDAVIDIKESKIGAKIHGYQVIPPGAIQQYPEAFILVAVGAPGARHIIRDWFAERGCVEVRDFLFLA